MRYNRHFKCNIKREIEYQDKAYIVWCMFDCYWDTFFKEYSYSDMEVNKIFDVDADIEVKFDDLPEELQQKINEIEPSYDEISDAEQDYSYVKAEQKYDKNKDNYI